MTTRRTDVRGAAPAQKPLVGGGKRTRRAFVPAYPLACPLLLHADMETTGTMVSVLAAGLILVATYAFALLLFTLVATLGVIMFTGIPFWFAVPPMLSSAHDASAALLAPRPQLAVARSRERRELAPSVGRRTAPV